MSEIFGAAGQIASAAIAAGATKDATQMQIDALNKQRDFVYNELSPDKVGGAATSADMQRAKDRLALQAITDPELLKQRYNSENKISGQAAQIGEGQGAQVAQTAASEAIAGVPKMKEVQQQLIDAALKELSLGATLPPDVQNEIVQTGLERAGQTQGTASAKGFGGQILRQVLGKAGIDLQNQRQAKATALSSAASDLESKRQQILGTLFPNLSTVQLNNLKGSQSVLSQSNGMVPEAGLGGTDIANLWLSRVGATNSLAQNSADAAAKGGMAQAQIWNQGIGGAVGYGASALPSTQSLWNSVLGGGGGGGSVADAQALAM
jgi:hypothetical protein